MARALGRGEHDLEAVETAVKAAVLCAGARALGEFMTAAAAGACEGRVCCQTCNTPMRGTGPRAKRILTMLGEAEYTRARYACAACGAVRYPGDEALDMAGTSRSPGVRRQAARLGAKESFREVSTDLAELAGIRLSRKDAERVAEGVGADIARREARAHEALRFAVPPAPEAPKTLDTLYIEMDGTGVPMVPWEVAGRKGKQPDGGAKTREAKLGCVFTQSAVDREGRPVRDANTTTFTGAIEDARRFGWRIYGEAVARGLFEAKRVAVLGDGAEWIQNLTESHFPMAIRILDLYHAKEHVAALCLALFTDPGRAKHYRERWWELLALGRIEEIIQEAAQFLSCDPRAHKDARREIAYLEANKEHMRYRKFREQGLFIGSGVIEAACKNLIGARLKESGMEWTVAGANSIIALRASILSRRFSNYWDQRAA